MFASIDQTPLRYEEFTALKSGVRAHGLKLLATESKFPFDLSGVSGDLVWLRLHNFDLFSLPPTISLRSLRVLEIHGLGKSLECIFGKVDNVSISRF